MKKKLLMIIIFMLTFSLCINVKATNSAVNLTDSGGGKTSSDSETEDEEEEKAVKYCCGDNGSNKTESYKPSEAPSNCSKGACVTCYCCSSSGNSSYSNQKSCATGCSTTACPLTCCKNGNDYSTSGVSCPTGERKGGCATPTVTATMSPGVKKLSDTESTEITFTHSGDVSPETIGCTGDTSAITCSVDGNKVTITANNTSDKCMTVAASATYPGTNTYKSASGTSDSITIYPKWDGPKKRSMKTSTNQSCATLYGRTRAEANKDGYNTARENCEESGGLCVCDVYTRGCGTEKIPLPACYEHKDTGFRYWGIYSGDKYEKIADVTNPNDCKVDYDCPKDSGPAENNVKTACNGQGDINGTYERYCKGPKKNFYKITCKEVIRSSFNGPVLDSSMNENNNAYLYYGTGFKYRYNATSNYVCSGEFDVNYYHGFLDSMIKYYGTICEDKGTTDKEIRENCDYFVNEHKKELINRIAESYYTWDPDYTFVGDVALTDEYQSQAKNATMTQAAASVTLRDSGDASDAIVCGKLVKDSGVSVSSGGKITMSGKANATDSDLSTASKFTYKKTQYIDKILPLACLKDGKVVYDQVCTDSQKLGSQFFVSDSRDAVGKDYTYKVEATNLGYKNFGSNNTKCNIEIVDNDIIYRHVDLNDPFIKKTNSGHQIGHNWLNNKYNFTQIIKSDIWSQDKEYKTITLDNNTNKTIKSETKGNTSYYTGSCDTNSKSTVCNILNNSKTNVRRSAIK